MQGHGGAFQVLEITLGAFLILFGLQDFFSCFGLCLLLISNALGLFLQGLRGVFAKGLVVLLRLRLHSCGLRFHGLGIRDELLQHQHHTVATGTLLVSSEGLGLLGCRDVFLHQGRLALLVVKVAQDTQSLLQQVLGGSLLSNHLLELLVLLLAVLRSQLLLFLKLLDIGLQGSQVFCGRLHLHLQRLALGVQIGHQALLLICGQLILLKLRDAVVLLLDLVRLFLLQSCHHGIDLLLDNGEPIELGFHGQSLQTQVLRTRLGQRLGRFLSDR
mmetsp:Transcript_31057/g.38137  ORF Transcript_31057/g.38137 Transcript_31057/m.38137 type:complete len:273 (-) Transcript_31057:787-1605(-)